MSFQLRNMQSEWLAITTLLSIWTIILISLPYFVGVIATIIYTNSERFRGQGQNGSTEDRINNDNSKIIKEKEKMLHI